MPNSTTLKNRQGSILYPKTQASITYMSNGNSVEAEINDLRQYEHNDKGYFTTEAELIQEYPNNIPNPESRAGWHAVVGETDTIWIWDVDNNQWFNSGNIISAVTSVNGKVGDVTLRGQDINATATRDTTSVTKTITGHLNDIYGELEETVTTNTDQLITGTKTFTNVIGLLNEDAGQVDQIKHINNNFLITSGSGKNLLNIDEGLETVNAFNRQLAFEDEIEEIQGHYVSYDQQTGKTEAQKAQARANIGAGTSDIDTVKVNGVAQPIENGSVNITLPETTQSIPILESASVWELDEGWYIFKDYVTISQLYIIRNNANREIPASILGYVSTSYVNTSNNNRLTKNLVLFCAEMPKNTSTIPVNVKSIAVATIIEVSEGSIFDLWETIKYDDFVTLGTGQTITGAKNFTGILEKGGKAVATEEYVNANGGKIDTISVNGVNQTITNKNVNLDVVESEDYLNGYVGTPLDNYYTKAEILNALYPIGTIYLTASTNGVGSSSPANWLGGTWERLPDGYALWTASSGAGSTIAQGLPNIEGSLFRMNTQAFCNGSYGNEIESTGALYGANGNTSVYFQTAGGSAQRFTRINFDASRWNNTYGNGSIVQPPAYKVYAWKRIA